MNKTTLDASDLEELFRGGAANLKLNTKIIDDLNVFPIPDGDTGSNMLMTIEGAVRSGGKDSQGSVSAFAEKFSKGALLGARGNSGVILSQFIKGFSCGIEDAEDTDSLDMAEFTRAFKAGVDKAYSAVIKPVEGTMLTVMREGWEYISEHESEFADFEDLFAALNRKMDESLEHTPELLPILKESGVIDSGGAGFLCIFHGMEKTLKGEKIEGAEHFHEAQAASGSASSVDLDAFTSDSELEFGYCTEFILRLQNSKTDIQAFSIDTIVSYLESIGNSIVAVMDGDLIKVHVHTFTPGEVLNFGQKFGEFITLKIENMSVQHNENSMFRDQKEPDIKKAEHKKVAVVAAVSGQGLKDLFMEIGVDVCVDGGQTENPSTEDFLEAFEQIDAEHIIVLPCNSNIVMASAQAAQLYTKAEVHVVKAKTIAEGYAAISMMDLHDGDVSRIIEAMEECISNTGTGLVTTATRDVDYDDISVKKGHYIGLDRERIISDSQDRIDAFFSLLKGIEGIRDKEVLTIFYGREVGEDEISVLDERLSSEFAWLEYGFISGGQPVYDYIFAAE